MTTVNIGQNSTLSTIGNNAFSGNSTLTAIYIPSGVTVIGDGAFNNAGSIDFTVAADNTAYRSENGHLIEKATNTLIRGGQSGTIPDTVSTIAQAAFRKAVKVTEIYIPKTVTNIGNYIVNDSTITKINYAGTQDDWNAIEKGKLWNLGNTDISIVFDTKTNTVLIVYFSWSSSGNTERMANRIAEKTGGDIVEIQAAIPYTGSYNEVANGRAKEEHDTNARPEVAAATYNAIDMEKYDTVFVGYPIWWWTTPMIIATFLEHYTWTAETNIYPFSQSASMDTAQFNTSMEQVRQSAQGATVHDGLFARPSNTSALDAYLTANGF